MCHTCRNYPRFSWNYGDVSFNGLYFSCPEVARIFLEHKEIIEFDLIENSISALAENENWELFNVFIRAFIISVDIMQNREIAFAKRLYLMTLFNNSFQEYLEAGRKCDMLLDTFSSPLLLADMLNSLEKHSENTIASFSFLLDFYKNGNDFRDIKYVYRIFNRIPAFLKKYTDISSKVEFEQLISKLKTAEFEIGLEQYSVYYLSKYYMATYKEGTPYKCIVKLIGVYNLLFYFMAMILDETEEKLSLSEFIPVFTALSRFFDHTASNREKLFELLEKNKKTDILSLLSLIH